ncbi:MAG: hypothetical protein HC906_02325 [Bacteroidales bacterium]|nr:hypothetical protein [Bacteroidales bacterium]
MISNDKNKPVIIFREENQDSAAYFAFSSNAVGLPDYWNDFHVLKVKVKNISGKEVIVTINIKGARTNLFIKKSMGPGKRSVFKIALDELPLTAGIQDPYKPSFVKIYACAGSFPAEIQIGEISLIYKPNNKKAVVDRYGQRINGTWGNKIFNDNQLKAIKDEFQNTGFTDRDKYGGSVSERYTATGYFRLEKTGKRWIFIDPDGHPFWSVGVNGVRPTSEFGSVTGATPVKAREFLFDQLPSDTGIYRDAWLDSFHVSFYYLNILKKYGSLNEWRNNTLQRLKTTGFNTIGNWSHSVITDNPGIVYTRTIITSKNQKFIIRKNIPDVFDTDYVYSLDSIMENNLNIKMIRGFWVIL